MPLRRFCLIVLLLPVALLASACEHARTSGGPDSAVRGPATNGTAANPAQSSAPAWDPGIGQLLLIPGDAPNHAFVFFPDSAQASASIAALPHPASVSLLGRSGNVQAADLPAVSDAAGCYTATLTAAPPPHAWNVGFVGGVVSPLPLDSTEALSRADSAALVVQATRLASALPNDSAGRFAGLPFTVHALWRFSIPGGPTVLVATTERQINQEATPLEERTLLVAERGASAADSNYVLVYSERSYGEEETIEAHDLVAAVSIGDRHTPALIVSRDFGDSGAYALIERDPDGIWRAHWVSGRRHC